MEQDTLFLFYDQDGHIICSASPAQGMEPMSKAARFAKDMVDISLLGNDKDPSECVEVWVRTDPRRMELLATFF